MQGTSACLHLQHCHQPAHAVTHVHAKCVAVPSLNFVPASHHTTLACHASYLACLARLACKHNCLSRRGHAVHMCNVQTSCSHPVWCQPGVTCFKKVCMQNNRRCCWAHPDRSGPEQTNTSGTLPAATHNLRHHRDVCTQTGAGHASAQLCFLALA